MLEVLTGVFIMYQKFKTNILVRDKMVEKMESDGILVDYKKLTQEDYIKALRKKVLKKLKKSQTKVITKN